jgi:hypothetical protein
MRSISDTSGSSSTGTRGVRGTVVWSPLVEVGVQLLERGDHAEQMGAHGLLGDVRVARADGVDHVQVFLEAHRGTPGQQRDRVVVAHALRAEPVEHAARRLVSRDLADGPVDLLVDLAVGHHVGVLDGDGQLGAQLP